MQLSKPKKMRIVFPDEKPPVAVTVDFDWENAPRTCSAICEYLKNMGGSFAGKALHASFAGRCLSIRDFNVAGGENLVPENATLTPAPGEIQYWYLPPHAMRGDPTGVKEINIFYGPDSRSFVPLGWVPGNTCAKVTENLEGLAVMGRRVNREGIKPIRIELVE